MDSTQAIIRFWRVCLPESAGSNGDDGAIAVEVLKAVLDKELAGNLEALGVGTVDDALQEYMQPDAGGRVGFLQYWQGMEQILAACGSMRNRLSLAKTDTLYGFYTLRNCILGMYPEGKPISESVFYVHEIKYFIREAMNVVGPEGEGYWQGLADSLPPDPKCCVTGEEVASALLAWLEELVCSEDNDDEAPPVDALARGSSGQSAVSGRDDDEESLDEGCGRGGMLSSVPTRHAGYSQRAIQQQMPGVPMGPPPSRGVRISSGSSYPATASIGAAPLRHGGGIPEHRRMPAPFEIGLVQLLHNMDKHPGSSTKEGHAEWLDANHFNVALNKHLGVAQAAGESLTLQFFYRFACEYFSAPQRRKPQQIAASPAQRDHFNGQAVRVLGAVLQGLFRRRKAMGFGAWFASWKASRCCGMDGLSESGEVEIWRALLRSQCETAVDLEARVTLAKRAGGLALCVASLQRARLRGSWVQWCQLLPRDPSASHHWHHLSEISREFQVSASPTRRVAAGAASPGVRQQAHPLPPRGLGETQQLEQLLESLR
mmetsp:Transcript_48926/g.124546  ORF Transcript_48926/g.124546 Transcript_48926/m.124546 type:complete len:544 (-) Transcript_48926:90-1721(-)